MKTRRQKVSFRATKLKSKPVRVKFYNKKGKEVSFTATKKIKTPVKVEFYTRPKAKKKK